MGSDCAKGNSEENDKDFSVKKCSKCNHEYCKSYIKWDFSKNKLIYKESDDSRLFAFLNLFGFDLKKNCDYLFRCGEDKYQLKINEKYCKKDMKKKYCCICCDRILTRTEFKEGFDEIPEVESKNILK